MDVSEAVDRPLPRPARSSRAIEPIVETDDEIRSALEEAEVPPLLPALAYLTGDLTLLREHLRPDPMLLGDAAGRPHRGPARRGAGARARGARSGSATASCGPRRRRRTRHLLQIMEFAVGGGADMAAYLPLLEEELAVRGEDRRAPAWRKDEIAPDTDFEVRHHRRGHVGAARRAPARTRRACRS